MIFFQWDSNEKILFLKKFKKKSNRFFEDLNYKSSVSKDFLMQKWKSVEENRKNGRDEKEFCNLIYESFCIFLHFSI